MGEDYEEWDNIVHPLSSIIRGANISGRLTHVVDPAHVGADPGEDRGLLVVVAAHAGAEAHHTMHVPGAVSVLAVQGTARVALKRERERRAARALRVIEVRRRVTHVAAGQLSVSSGTDHAAGDQAAPPVVPAAG